MKKVNTLFALLALALVASQLSCTVNDYCLGCEIGDGGNGSGADDARDGGELDDSGTDANCVPSGVESCDGKDNDCNGLVDDGTLPGVGAACSNQTGPCAGGRIACNAGTLKCDKPPAAEQCDGIDNNCNGQTDEGDPGGGGTCGTDVGECVAGTQFCNTTTGQLECFGFQDHRTDPELCDGKDNDCDGMLDEMIGSLGSCGPSVDTGPCEFGTLQCEGGAAVCKNAVFPTFETCNNIDDNCNGPIDEIFSKATDPNNCVTCNNVCPAASMTCINSTNALNDLECTSVADCTGTHPQKACVANSQRRCNNGCTFACNAGFKDLDLQAANGCEYRCSSTGAEECDGVDNDCDGLVDEMLTAPPGLCRSGGECGTTAPSATCGGTAGWSCSYSGQVQFPETRCDNLDNDCDANIDENQPNKNVVCDDSRVGVCRGTGSFVCNAVDRDGPATCVISSPGQVTPDPVESCNGKDDDCDGSTDEAATDNFVEVRDSGSVLLFRIYTYEASRPDATTASPGTMAHRACSRPGVQPWASVTHAQAAAACAAVDPPKSRLCAASEWQLACSGNAGRTFPYGNTYDSDACNGNDYDPNCTLPDDDRALLTGAAHGCPTKPALSACVSPSGAFDLSGNLKEWTSTQTSPGAFNVRGGSFDSVAGGLACDFAFVSATTTFSFANLGFRCCADP